MLAIQLKAIEKAIECNQRRTRPIESRILRQRMIDESIARIDKIVVNDMNDVPLDDEDGEQAPSDNVSGVDKEAATSKRTFQDPTAQWPPGEPVKPHEGFTPPSMHKVTEDEFEVPESHTGRFEDTSS